MNVDLNIIEEEGDLFYFYHNWRAGQENKIHKATCNFCRYGSGRNFTNPPNRGDYGVWIGPFSTLEFCHNYIANKLQIAIPDNCTKCF